MLRVYLKSNYVKIFKNYRAIYKFLQAVNIGNIICEFYEPFATKEFQAEVKIRIRKKKM